MSLNEEKNNKDQNESVVSQQTQDELACEIQISINNIATQVDILNKHIEEIIGNIFKDVDQISGRIQTLQDNVIQITNNFANKDTNKNDSIESTEFHKCSQITDRQKEKEDTLIVSLCKTQDDISIQTSPTYSENDFKVLTNYHDNMCSCETFEEMFIPEIKENQGKLNQSEYLDDPNLPQNMPPDIVIQDQIPVDHTQATCGDISYLYLNQPEESSSYSTEDFSDISKLTGAEGKVLSNPPLLKSKDSIILITSKYVRYGTGTREVQLHPQIQHTTEVFIGPAAPPSPPLPPNWLNLLRASVITNPPVKPSTKVTLLDLSPAAESHLEYIETITQADFEALSAEEDSSLTASEHFEYKKSSHEPIKKDQEVQFPPVPSSPVILDIDETKDRHSDLPKNASLRIRSSKISVIPNSMSPCLEPSKTSVASRSKSPCVQSSKSSASVRPSKTSVSPHSRSACMHPSKTSVFLCSGSPCVQPSKTSFTSRSKSPCVRPSKTSVTSRSKSPCVQPSKTSVTPNSKLACVQPPKTSVTPNSKLACVQPSKTSVTRNSKSACIQSPKPSVSKTQRLSFISTPSSSQPIRHAYQNPPVTKSITPKPNHSTQQISNSPIACPSCSHSCSPKSSVLPTRVPASQTQTIPITPSSRFSDIPSSESSSESSLTTYSTGHLIPPPQSSDTKPTTPFSLLSLLPFPPSSLSTSISNPQGPSVSQRSPAPVSQRVKQAPSIPPIFNKAKCALMDVVRKGVPLPKADEQSALKSKSDITENEKKLQT